MSRSRLFELEPLSPEHVGQVLDRAIADREHGFGREAISLLPVARAFLVETSDGNARRGIRILEVGA